MLGTDKAVEKTFDVAERMIDKLVYTSEEKADEKANAAREARGMIVEWVNATSGSRLARRIIALAFTFCYLSLFMIATVFDAVAVFISEANAKLMSAASDSLDGRIDILSGAVMLILAFYFAAPQLPKFADAAIAKFTQRKSAND